MKLFYVLLAMTLYSCSLGSMVAENRYKRDLEKRIEIDKVLIDDLSIDLKYWSELAVVRGSRIYQLEKMIDTLKVGVCPTELKTQKNCLPGQNRHTKTSRLYKDAVENWQLRKPGIY